MFIFPTHRATLEIIICHYTGIQSEDYYSNSYMHKWYNWPYYIINYCSKNIKNITTAECSI